MGIMTSAVVGATAILSMRVFWVSMQAASLGMIRAETGAPATGIPDGVAFGVLVLGLLSAALMLWNLGFSIRSRIPLPFGAGFFLLWRVDTVEAQ